MTRILGAFLLTLFFVQQSRSAPNHEIKVGTEKVLVSGPTVSRPTAAFGGGLYLVVWQDGWAGVGATADIKGIRLQSSTLEPLDKEPICICTAPEAQEAPAIAFADGVFLVVWQDFRNGKHYSIRGARIDAATGRLRAGELEIATRPVSQCRPCVTSNGKNFLVVWQEFRDGDNHGIRGVRLSPAGKLLDPLPHDYATSGTSPVVCSSGNRVLVAWTVKQRNQAKTAAALVDPVTGQKVKNLGTINTCCGDGLAAAGDGQGNFVTVAGRASAPDPWGWGGPGAVVLSRVQTDGSTPESKLNYAYRLSNLCSRSVPNVIDAAVWKGAKTWNAGAPGGFPGTEDGLWPTGSPTVAADGKGTYLFAWTKGRLSRDRLNVYDLDIWLRGMDGQTLAVRISDRKVVANSASGKAHPVLVLGPKGEILLLCESFQPSANRSIAARRLSVGE